MEDLIEINNEVLQNLINNSMQNDLAQIAPAGIFGLFAGFFVGAKLMFFWMLSILYLAALWVIFQKAKKPGWAAIVPIYNIIVYLDVVDRPWWWLLLLFVPVVNVVIAVIITHDLSLAFKRDAWFTVGMVFFPWIFAPILAFGKDKYTKPKH